MKKFIIAGMAVAMLAVPAAASASVNVNDFGHGFVGKGDVQDVFGGWSNKQLQDKADKLAFNINSSNVKMTADEWTCTKTTTTPKGEVKETVQERALTTTTTKTTTSVVKSVGRVKNQITGFNMEGFLSSVSTSDSIVDGPAVNSCPDASSGYVFDADSSVHTDVSDVTTGGVLTVTDGSSTHSLPNTPVEVAPLA